MRIAFANRDLEELYTKQTGAKKYPAGVVKRFSMVVQLFQSVPDSKEIYCFSGLKYEKLKGKRSHQHSARLNDQFRLITEHVRDGQGEYLLLVAIEDYH